ncbi:hypothetical protein ACC782_33970 [Rhizobium ruizarguesonis]
MTDISIVKPLEWEVYPNDGTRMFEGQNEQRQYISRALPPIGPAIFIMKKDDVYSIEDREGIYGTESDAKLVAQTDYERRILSALSIAEPCEPAAWRHTIVEPDGRENIMLSRSAVNPWSHWVDKHLGECVYTCTPLYESLTTA